MKPPIGKPPKSSCDLNLVEWLSLRLLLVESMFMVERTYLLFQVQLSHIWVDYLSKHWKKKIKWKE